MTDHLAERLSDYIDDELSPADCLDVERHLLDCAACRASLDGLQRVVSGARTLEDEPPTRDLWPSVRAALPVPMARRTIHLSIPQALAAGILLAIVSSLCVWLFVERGRITSGVAATRTPPAAAVMTPVSLADPQYDKAVADLSRILADERSHLSPKTVDALERNLATIDRAIAEARDALAQDPSSQFLSSHLAQQRRTKLTLLRQVTQRVRPGL